MSEIFGALPRFLFEIVAELFLQVFCYATGRFLVKVFTVGRKPAGKYRSYQSGWSDAGLILLGIAFWVVWALLICWLLFKD